MGNEVEVKIKLSVEEFSRLESFLVGLGVPCKVEEHCDVYFGRPDAFLSEKFPFEWLSIRQRNEITSICYKHFFPEREEEHTHCKEVEVQVASAEAASLLLTSLGFTQAIVVKKARTSFTYKRTRVELDRVDELGLFVEIEARERVNLAEANSAVRETLNDLGLSHADRDLRGYPYRMLEKGVA